MSTPGSFKSFFTVWSLLILMNIQSTAQSIVASGYTFSATSKTYSYLSGGNSLPAIQVDDDYTTVGIGFPFTFCGTTYYDVTLCSNGWLRFGTGPGSSGPNWNYNAQVNSGIQPCVYALYEDVSGALGTSSYLSTGTAPNRIFKWECKNWLWDYAATTPCVSFQVWLYEATGVIECIYKQEAGSVVVGSSGGATIGIANSGTDWQTLNNVSSSPTSSSTTYTYTLSATPATGQSYVWDPGPACNVPTVLTVNLVNSMYVDISWTAAASSVGYEYIIDQSPSAPLPTAVATFTAGTNITKGGLTPSTRYYIHVRNKCGASNYSQWVTLPFNTLPACVVTGLQVPYVDSNSATITWVNISTAIEYEYFVKLDKTPPASNAGAGTTTNNVLNIKPLLPGNTYYIFIRVKCIGSDSSSWMLDSFYVPIPCRAPNVLFDDLNDSRSVAYWATPLAAYEYEIINSTSPLSNPVAGIKLVHNSYLLPFLDPNTEYFFYARSYCDDKGVHSISPWGMTNYTTWALGVNNINFKNKAINVYPNPVHDNLALAINVSITKGAMLALYDITGKVLKTQSVSNNRVTINVSSLPSGIYILQYSDDKHVEQTRFYKQ